MVDQIGPYHIVRLIAESNTAEIFRARRIAAGRAASGEEVALKVLRPQFARSRVDRRHLWNEGRVGAVLKHPVLIRVQEVVLNAPRPYLVMERFPGPSLRQRLGVNQPWGVGGRITPAEALPHLVRLAKGLEYMHEEGWVHRDVKPQNVLIGQNNQTRLIDMALAERIGRRGWLRCIFRRHRRRTEGTRSYMSPEQIRGLPVDGRSDVYSFGVTLFEVLAGRPPFVSDDPSRILAMHLSAPVPRVSRFASEIDPGLDDVVQEMLAKRPEERLQTMAHVVAKLSAFVPTGKRSKVDL